MHTCPYCGYSFPSSQDLLRHLEEGRGCPAQDDIRLARTAGLLRY